MIITIILTFFKSFFGGIFSIIKNLISGAIAHPKLAIAIVLILLALGGGYEIKHQFDLDQAQIVKLQQANTSLTQANTQLKVDIANAVGVNQQDQTTINQLSEAKTDSDARVAQMVAQEQANQTKISNLRQMIANSTAAQDGPVSNVLAETINAIQQNRKAGSQ